MKQYKAISGPQTIDVNSHENISEAAEKYEKFVNEQAAAGWEYHSASTIIVNKKGGCLRKDSAAKYKMMIFAREGTEGSAPLAENEDHSQVSFETANTENTTDTATHASNKKWIFIVLAGLLVVLIGVVVYNVLCGRAPFFVGKSKEALSNDFPNSIMIGDNYFTYKISTTGQSLYESSNLSVDRPIHLEYFNVSVTDYDASRDLYSEDIYYAKKENRLFTVTILPTDLQYDGIGKQIGDVDLDTKGKTIYGTKPISPGIYAIYVTVYEQTLFTEQVWNASVSVSEILRSISSRYGTINLYDNVEDVLQSHTTGTDNEAEVEDVLQSHTTGTDNEAEKGGSDNTPKNVAISGTYVGCTYNGDTQKFHLEYKFNPDGTFKLSSHEYRVDSEWELCGGGPSFGTYSVDGERICLHTDDLQSGKFDTTYYYRLEGVTLYLGETKNNMIPYYETDGEFSSLAGYTIYSVARNENEITVYTCEFHEDGTFNEHAVDYSNMKYDPFPDADADSYGWYVQPKGHPSLAGDYYSSTSNNDMVVMHSDYDCFGEPLEEYNALMLLYMNEATHTLVTSDQMFYITRVEVNWENICPFFGVSLD